MLADKIARLLIKGNRVKTKDVEHNGRTVEFTEVKNGCLIDKILEKTGKAAVTLGRTVILREGRTNPRRIRHELVHVDQWVKYGTAFFFIYIFKVKDFEEEAEEGEKKP